MAGTSLSRALKPTSQWPEKLSSARKQWRGVAGSQSYPGDFLEESRVILALFSLNQSLCQSYHAIANDFDCQDCLQVPEFISLPSTHSGLMELRLALGLAMSQELAFNSQSWISFLVRDYRHVPPCLVTAQFLKAVPTSSKFYPID